MKIQKKTEQSSQYSDDELASAQSLHTLKDTKVRTEETGKDPSDTETSELIGTKYMHKRSRSEGDIQQDMSSDIHDMVSKNEYGKHHTTKSLDELTFNRFFLTYKYAYVTVVRAETESND